MASGAILETLTAAEADASVVDDDGVRHRVWVVPAEHVEMAVPSIDSSPWPRSADRHRRRPPSLRHRPQYRDGRGTVGLHGGPAHETIFVLLFDLAATELTILPTHRVVDGGPTGDVDERPVRAVRGRAPRVG
jgi:hypothetical protein